MHAGCCYPRSGHGYGHAAANHGGHRNGCYLPCDRRVHFHLGYQMTLGPGLIATRLTLEYLVRAYKDGGDLEARKEMMNAATMGGMSFGNSMAGLAHSTGHALGAIFHVPHGRAVGLFLPYTMEYLINESAETTAKYAEIARYCSVASSGSDKECALALVARVRALAGELGQPLSIKDCGVGQAEYEKEIPRLIERALNEVMTMTCLLYT